MGSVPSGGVIIERGFGKCTSWMTADELLEHLEEGDLIEFERDLYRHWGAFVQKSNENGVYYVVHLSGDVTDELIDSVKSKLGSTSGHSLGASLQMPGEAAIVQLSNLVAVANNRRCRINNLLDRDLSPFPADVIVARGLSEIGKRKYNALFTNCEHFATWCRYGTKNSRQSSLVKTIATGVVAGVVSGSAPCAVAGAGGYFAISRLARRIKNRNRESAGW